MDKSKFSNFKVIALTAVGVTAGIFLFFGVQQLISYMQAKKEDETAAGGTAIENAPQSKSSMKAVA